VKLSVSSTVVEAILIITGALSISLIRGFPLLQHLFLKKLKKFPFLEKREKEKKEETGFFTFKKKIPE